MTASTPAPTTADLGAEALREVLARHGDESAWNHRTWPDRYWVDRWRSALREADALIAGPLANFLETYRITDIMAGVGYERMVQAGDERDEWKARARAAAAEAAGLRVELAEARADADSLGHLAAQRHGEAERARADAVEMEAQRDFQAAACVTAEELQRGAEATLAAERRRIATLEAESASLHKDNERLRWRHPGILPAWNDLADDMRGRIVEAARYYDPLCGPEVALRMYGAVHDEMAKDPTIALTRHPDDTSPSSPRGATASEETPA